MKMSNALCCLLNCTLCCVETQFHFHAAAAGRQGEEMRERLIGNDVILRALLALHATCNLSLETKRVIFAQVSLLDDMILEMQI